MGRVQLGEFHGTRQEPHFPEATLCPPTDLVTGVNVHSIAQVVQSLVQVP